MSEMRTPRKPYNIYTTQQEMRFLDHVGSYHDRKFSHLRRRFTQARLLSAYIRAAPRRVQWGAIDQIQVVAYATALLGCLQRTRRGDGDHHDVSR